MPKKSKDEPSAAAIVNKDVIQRLNFLYQASAYLNAIPEAPGRSERSQKNHRLRSRDLAKFYIADMQTVGQKTTVKIDPNVKRTICKGCNTTLIPGTSASIRVKNSKVHGSVMVYTCNECKTSKRIPAPPVPKAQDSLGPTPSISSGDRAPGEALHIQYQNISQTEDTHLAMPKAVSTADDSMQDCSNHHNLDHTASPYPSTSFSASSISPVTTITAASPHSHPNNPSSLSHNSSSNATIQIPSSQQTASSAQSVHSKSNKKRQESSTRPRSHPRSRLPPHFARDAEEGHVVFVGNERLPDTGAGGSGVYIS